MTDVQSSVMSQGQATSCKLWDLLERTEVVLQRWIDSIGLQIIGLLDHPICEAVIDDMSNICQ